MPLSEASHSTKNCLEKLGSYKIGLATRVCLRVVNEVNEVSVHGKEFRLSILVRGAAISP